MMANKLIIQGSYSAQIDIDKTEGGIAYSIMAADKNVGSKGGSLNIVYDSAKCKSYEGIISAETATATTSCFVAGFTQTAGTAPGSGELAAVYVHFKSMKGTTGNLIITYGTTALASIAEGEAVCIPLNGVGTGGNGGDVKLHVATDYTLNTNEATVEVALIGQS